MTWELRHLITIAIIAIGTGLIAFYIVPHLTPETSFTFGIVTGGASMLAGVLSRERP